MKGITLLFVVLATLVGGYFALLWGPTKNYGPTEVRKMLPSAGFEGLGVENTEAVAPLLIRHWESGYPRSRDRRIDCYSYYFWFFGYVAKLPYEWVKEHPRDVRPRREIVAHSINEPQPTLEPCVRCKAPASSGSLCPACHWIAKDWQQRQQSKR